MPIRRRFLMRSDALTGPERMDLMLGDRGAFASDEERRDAWEAHRGELLARTQQGFGTGPQALWDYEGPAELRYPSDWRRVTPERELAETFGRQRAGEVTAATKLSLKRRAWLNAHLPWKAA